MSYLEEFRFLIESQDPSPFLRLWEEYCLAEEVVGEELVKILELIKNSQLAPLFGKYAESILPLWKAVSQEKAGDDVLRLILDLQTTNSPLLAELGIDFLKNRYGNDPHFQEKLRIIGLRGKHSFPSAIRNFELLSHMDRGSFVFHNGGWGVGEVMDISLLREHVAIEFEGITTLKELSFDNAFKNLIPLPSKHFLSRRFGDPDRLEKEGKDDPLLLIHLLLSDLGPKTAIEIKDELCNLVIPESDWSKWWQSARAKIKKDTMIASPKSSRDAFVLRDEEISHGQRLKEALKDAKSLPKLIGVVYSFLRDFPHVLKDISLKEKLKEYLEEALKGEDSDHTLGHRIELLLLLEDIAPDSYGGSALELLKSSDKINEALEHIAIVALKKRALTTIREGRDDWATIFLHLLFVIDHNPLRDYLFKELEADETTRPLLKDKLVTLLHRVSLFPEAFFWYFQKLVANEEIPLNSAENKREFLEAYLILLHYIENDPDKRDLTKKMHQLFHTKRYAMVRQLIEGASVPYLEELLLLSTKCHTLTKHDRKILQSLAAVVQPSLGAGMKKETSMVQEVIWTTQEGYQKLQERIRHLGTVETVDNAKEIEAARALGDLRENAEYKFALERRAHLQSELKTLSDQLNKARILTKGDITTDEVNVGVKVDLLDSKGKIRTYTLLGPWDADPDNHILSFQSKLAQAMIGHKKGESFDFQGEQFKIQAIKSYL